MRAMRRSNKLSAAKVVKITAPGMYGDGDGLWLQVREIEDGLSKTWIFRYMFAGRARYMGLGPLRQVPLAKARARASEARDLIYSGSDPIEARRKRRDDARSQNSERVLFKDAANLHPTYATATSPLGTELRACERDGRPTWLELT